MNKADGLLQWEASSVKECFQAYSPGFNM